jgi:hypothetical protein
LRGVLKKLEEDGIFIHLTTKQEILRQRDGRSNSLRKFSSAEIYNERGGKLSVYTLADDIEKLKRAMEKPGSIEYLYQELIKSGLAERLFKFLLLAFLYSAKIDKKILATAMVVAAAFSQDSQIRIDTAESFRQLQQIDDNKLEEYVEGRIKSIIEDRDYYCMLFIGGLIKL